MKCIVHNLFFEDLEIIIVNDELYIAVRYMTAALAVREFACYYVLALQVL